MSTTPAPQPETPTETPLPPTTMPPPTTTLACPSGQTPDGVCWVIAINGPARVGPGATAQRGSQTFVGQAPDECSPDGRTTVIHMMPCGTSATPVTPVTEVSVADPPALPATGVEGLPLMLIGTAMILSGVVMGVVGRSHR